MDLRRTRSIIVFIIILSIFLQISLSSSSSNGVFRVHHKFYGQQRSLSALSAHDTHRRGRILSAIDIPLGGNGNPNNAGLYYAKIQLGSPPQDYHVQVDTGSDLLWVNCIQCTTCHKESGIGIKLRLYDPKESVTAKVLPCDTDFCGSVHHGQNECTSNGLCLYQVRYADGSQTDGYFVRDTLVYDRVTGNDVPSPGNASVVFGCGAKQSGDLGTSNEAVDGIIGFGQSNSSVLSQLADAGKVKKVFSHCLDGQNGGGIFAIGQVVKPKVKSTPLVPDQLHYNVNLKDISVGKSVLDLPSDLFETGERKGTIIDSGTTLAYLPDIAYKALLSEILSNHGDLRILVVESQYQCFQYSGSVDDGFPTVTFHFEDSVTLTVYPHEYLFTTEVAGKELWCFGWQNAGLQQEAKDLALLGDIVLSNKLFVYDLENQVIGWTEYNCSSSIELLDDHSKSTSVDAHDLSSAYTLNTRRILLMGLLSIVLHKIYF